MMRVPLILCASTILAVGEAAAFGPGVHAYLAMQVLGPDAHLAVYGAMAADLNGAFERHSEVKSAMQRLTHYEFGLLSPSVFAAGFATHNGDWGADGTAHRYLHTGHTEGWVTDKLKLLSDREGITMFEAEDLYDAALDLMLAQRLGPALGELVESSAAQAGPEEEQQLVEAFAAPLAERANLKPEDAESRIRWAHRSMRQVLIVYGRLLARDRGYQRPIGDFLVARAFGWPPAEARLHLTAALELAEDVVPQLDALAVAMREQMNGVPAYADYLVRPLALAR
ncbi:MAG: hypothetical protein GC168_07025 [Candidatus Hydrogenedens sp.]|nr:hypothetical protein [Candidatus Hydrogenedens sp.]